MSEPLTDWDNCLGLAIEKFPQGKPEEQKKKRRHEELRLKYARALLVELGSFELPKHTIDMEKGLIKIVLEPWESVGIKTLRNLEIFMAYLPYGCVLVGWESELNTLTMKEYLLGRFLITNNPFDYVLES